MKNIMLVKLILLFLLSSLTLIQVQATHLRGGYITFTADQQNPRKHNFKLFLYSNTESPAREVQAQIFMGDGVNIIAPLKSRTQLCDKTDESIFEWEYTFNSEGTYTPTYSGITRNAAILNMDSPSEQITMVISTTLAVNSLFGPASGVRFNSPSFASAYVGIPFKFNLLAYDPDGDSLAYNFAIPLHMNDRAESLYVPGYRLPDGVFINQSGEINWPAPAAKGEYSFVVQVTKYNRNTKVLRSTTINEVQIIVKEPTSEPQVLLVNQDALPRSPEGYIIARPGSGLKLIYFVQELDQGSLKELEHAGELLADHLKNQYTLQVAERDSANGKVKELIFTFPPEMQRSKPYVLGVRGVADITTHHCSNYGQVYTYLLVTNQTITSVPDLREGTAQQPYPNPAYLYFTIENTEAYPTLLIIYAADGKVAYQAQLQPGRNFITRPSNLRSGLYNYTISRSGEQTGKGKLLLQ